MDTAQIPFLHDLALVLGSSPALLLTLDLLFKSTLLIGLTLLASWIIATRSGSGHRHLLWINSILCLALLPLILALRNVFPGESAGVAQIFSLSVIADSVPGSEASSSAWVVSDAGFYVLLLPCLRDWVCHC